MYYKGDWVLIFLVTVMSAVISKPYMYVIQQDNYRLKELLYSKRIKSSYVTDVFTSALFSGIFVWVCISEADHVWCFLILTFSLLTECLLYFTLDGAQKKPLRYTPRAIRATIFVVMVVMGAVLTIHFAPAEFWGAYPKLRYLVYSTFPIFYPLIFVIALSAINVFERLNNWRYELKTKKILQSSNAVKIAITGSFGKTSVKNYLNELLSIKYNVLATPASFNTPMGISKTVKGLDVSHQVFIAEMGARRVNDIKRLMKIISPDIGILTGLNAQHIQTFKTEQNIVHEKLHVVDMLKKDGFCVINSAVSKNKNATINSQAEVVFAGLDGEVFVSDVRPFVHGTSFCLHFQDRTYNAFTGLLGTHNVENLALASAVAYRLGVPEDLIVDKIASICPVEHRLQLIESGGIKIIDDTFNSNPDGARLALETLESFEGRKVVVTPGLVELGEVEIHENKILGANVARVADVAVLIGKRAKYIEEGMEGFNGKVLHFDSLKQAQKSFKDFLSTGDVVLLLNDLPDIYEDF